MSLVVFASVVHRRLLVVGLGFGVFGVVDPMSLPNPATIWTCPECSLIWQVSQPAYHYPYDVATEVCPGTPVLRLLVDPATTREGLLWTKQAPPGSTAFPEWVCTNGVFEPAWSEADTEPVDCLVLVFDAPKETP